MGRTPIPLVIWVDSGWRDHPEVLALEEKGHKIEEIEALWSSPRGPDVILSRLSHAWADDMWKLLPNVLKEARRRRKESPSVDE